MTNYITLDRTDDIGKEVLINNAFKKFNNKMLTRMVITSSIVI